MSRLARAWWIGLLAGGLAGCAEDPCEDAAQLCADQRQATGEEEGDPEAECAGQIERHSECIVEAESCAPDVVAACWRSAAEGAR